MKKNWPDNDQPFEAGDSPIQMKVKAKRIPEWQIDKFGLVSVLQPSPAISNEPLETVTLIPMGAARLRISAFPTIGKGSDAHQWIAAPRPKPKNASHCFGGDSVVAIWDGLEPKNSTDLDIPRFTWWPHLGTQEWIEFPLMETVEISSVEIYWFDDTDTGHCSVPLSWRLLYKDGSDWKEVKIAGSYGTTKDKYYKVIFKPIKTSVVRVEAVLRPEYSAGILEMKVKYL